MTGRLKQYPPSLQFAAFMALFLICGMLYFIFLVAIFPLISGYSLLSLQQALTDAQASSQSISPKVLGYLKLTQFLYTLIVYLLPPVIFAWLSFDRPASWLRIDRKLHFLPVILSLLIMLLALPLVSYIAEWNHSWPFSPALREAEKQTEALTRVLLIMPDVSSLLINLIMIAVIPAIAEEFFFRGVVQQLFIRMMPKVPWLAIVITAICFSAIHMQWMDFVPRVLLGFLLGTIYYLSGNLWLSIVGHFLNNGLQVLLVYLYQIKVIKTDPMEAEATQWYLALGSLVLTITAAWLLYKKTPPAERSLTSSHNFEDNIDSIGK
ncbi:CPBP family intramembrane glutamic endopeptidase [Chitinophaga rhizophila]|uniref:CPBP family intramembrane metalloprotease n=1 Tax=Chitinophaga rhizophila TaxID=2866212 RepID=A0ABS7GFK4_9BACT|nr:CPBP family intramembrane glutamic endopeptidase [Chitinophaga rhizophila]MBW8686025.1 CPBP family intramembrane metalloprotease [Chitinophaga rhizophila]